MENIGELRPTSRARHHHGLSTHDYFWSYHGVIATLKCVCVRYNFCSGKALDNHTRTQPSFPADNYCPVTKQTKLSVLVKFSPRV